MNVIIPAGKMANSKKLVSLKRYKNPSRKKKAIEIPAKIFEKYIHHPNVKSLSSQAP